MSLFEPQRVQWSVPLELVYEDELPDPALVSNVRVLCSVGEQIVLITSEEYGPIGLPGGTLEPGESIEDGLAREIMEEVGALVRSHRTIARIRFHSEGERPYRPHIPHPEFHWAVGVCQVEIVGSPTQPPGGERIAKVEVLSVERACDVLREAGKAWEAELVAHLAAARNT